MGKTTWRNAQTVPTTITARHTIAWTSLWLITELHPQVLSANNTLRNSETPRQSPPTRPRKNTDVASEMEVGCHALVHMDMRAQRRPTPRSTCPRGGGDRRGISKLRHPLTECGGGKGTGSRASEAKRRGLSPFPPERPLPGPTSSFFLSLATANRHDESPSPSRTRPPEIITLQMIKYYI